MTYKRCFKCGEVKPLSDFYAHPRMADGHLNKCKNCTKKDSKRRRDDSPKSDLQTRLNACAEKPNHKNAYMAVDAAIRSGVLEKPDTCSSCGCHSSAHRIEAHHEDYRKPLDVVWLCTPCHRKADAERRVREGLNAYPACKKVAMMDVDEHVIKTFDSQKEAALFVSRAPNSISQAVKSGGICAGYRWKSM